MGINKSEITDDGTNVFVAEDFVGNLVSGSDYIDVVQGRRPLTVISQGPNTDIGGVPPINEVERDRLNTPIDISFNQIDFYTPDGTYLPSLEVIINTLVEGADDYVINYVKLS